MNPVEVQVGKRTLVLFAIDGLYGIVADDQGKLERVALDRMRVLGPAGHWPPPRTLVPRRPKP